MSIWNVTGAEILASETSSGNNEPNYHINVGTDVLRHNKIRLTADSTSWDLGRKLDVLLDVDSARHLIHALTNAVGHVWRDGPNTERTGT